MKAGIIGVGSLGRRIAEFLKECELEVSVFDIDEKRTNGLKKEDKKKLLQTSDVIIIATPIEETAKEIIEAAENMKRGALLMDVCSVKSHLIEAFDVAKKRDIEIISMHPLFGPDQKGRIVLIPIKTNHLEKVKKFLEEGGFETVISDIEEHERGCALTQGVFSVVCRLLSEKVNRKFATRNFEDFLEIAEKIKKNSNLSKIRETNSFVENAKRELGRRLNDENI